MTSVRLILTSASLAFVAIGLIHVSAARAEEHAATYSVSLIGIPIARLDFRTTINGADYRISGSLKTSFVAEVIEPTRGSVTSAGRIVGDRFQASEFEVKYKTGDKRYRAAMSLSGGNVRSHVVEPEKTRPPSWVPVRPRDLRGVLDPLGGMVVPAGVNPCGRTVPAFDGESRFDLKLTPKGTRPFRTSGFAGEATVCGLRFVPKSGYRRDNRSVEYVRRQTGMEIWFAEHPSGRYIAPVRAKVPTKIGTMIVSATHYGH